MKVELSIRLLSFIVVFALLAIGEHFAPRRDRTISRSVRWLANLGLLAMNPLSVRLLFPFLPVGVALWTQEQHWGLLTIINGPYMLNLVVTILILDLTVYLQHVLFHALPLLWRLHMVHHADLDFDFTTGLRFHPLEIIISLVIKILVVVLLGPPVMAVVAFEVLLNATAMFNHSNIHIPARFDSLLRLLVVTPDMHRVHHSVIIKETNSNYGFSFPWWDRLMGTYKAQPVKGHTDMTIGLAQFRDQNRLGLLRLVLLPFIEKPGSVPINRH